jgi:glucokinase
MAEMNAAANNTPKASRTIGIVMAERIYAGLVVDHKLQGELRTYPAGSAPHDADDDDSLVELPTDSLVKELCELIATVAKGSESSLDAVGVALPGLIRNGVVEEAPNLPQLKGARIQELLTAGLVSHGITAPVDVLNDADGVAAGLASRHGKLDHMIRVWTLGTGIGYGRYPFVHGVWEGGHTVVSLDDKERFCGCGGRGHLEGIMGHRAMRLRFLDLEPEEVFASANTKNGDPRCLEFKHLWHKALAAATATSIHQAGPGKFFLTGFNVRFVDLNMLKDYLHQMVKMSPIQGYSIEIVEDDHTTRVIGAAVTAEQAAER